MINEKCFDSVRELFEYFAPWNNSQELIGCIFRGHSNESYKLIPNVLRPENAKWLSVNGEFVNDEKTNFFRMQIKAEYQLLREFYKLADRQGLGVPIADLLRKNLDQSFKDFEASYFDQEADWLPENLYEATALAQHYGIPTRLLDWTYDPFIAFYFAFKGAIDDANKEGKSIINSGNVVIWALNQNNISLLKSLYYEIDVVFITPHYASNPNLNAQKGLFTLILDKFSKKNFTGDSEPVEASSLDEFIMEQIRKRSTLDGVIEDDFPSVKPEDLTLMKKFVIPASEAVEGLKILERMGYSTSRIFPGYDGVAKETLEKHRIKK